MWDRSLAVLASVGKFLLLTGVAALPWLPVAAVAALAAYAVFRRRSRASKRTAWQAGTDAAAPPAGPFEPPTGS